MVATNIFSFHPDPSGTGIQLVFLFVGSVKKPPTRYSSQYIAHRVGTRWVFQRPFSPESLAVRPGFRKRSEKSPANGAYQDQAPFF